MALIGKISSVCIAEINPQNWKRIYLNIDFNVLSVMLCLCKESLEKLDAVCVCACDLHF
jgi:hypothetical protein